MCFPASSYRMLHYGLLLCCLLLPVTAEDGGRQRRGKVITSAASPREGKRGSDTGEESTRERCHRSGGKLLHLKPSAFFYPFQKALLLLLLLLLSLEVHEARTLLRRQRVYAARRVECAEGRAGAGIVGGNCRRSRGRERENSTPNTASNSGCVGNANEGRPTGKRRRRGVEPLLVL